MADVQAMTPLEDPDAKLPFIREILGNLRRETEGRATLLGFVGAPFTLVAYAVEGQANRHCINTKKMMMNAPEVLHAALDNLAVAIGEYACHQIDCGAQSVQFFESWAHHLSPAQFEVFAKPYVDRAMAYVKARHPDVPVMYYANGGSSYLDLQRDMQADVISLDWAVDMGAARRTLGENRLVQGNVDPTVLFGTPAQIREAVQANIAEAGGKGRHILNLGHGVIQGTPEAAVDAFVRAAKEM
jgi:uroporphyrinogen decarboxylase